VAIQALRRDHFDAVVLGAGGFIGGHLTAALAREGKTVLAVDKKPMAGWYQWAPESDAVHSVRLNVANLPDAHFALEHAAGAEVYDLAADMGGIGFIESNKLDCMLSVLAGTHTLMAAAEHDAGRFFFSSSACVYSAVHQDRPDVTALHENHAYPALPEDGYGWEKLFTERMCRHFREDRGLATRVARYHNIYGPYGTWQGGREKAPAAACRKVAVAALTGDRRIDVWGDGEQTRSFTYVDDCVEGTLKIARSDHAEPLNLGSSELVTINRLYELVADVAGVTIQLNHIPGPQGVRGRNSDNTLIRDILGWEPSTSLADGIAETYRWVYDQVKATLY
jgi:GDP-D-mannose 3', 5'-epimerase